MIAKIAHMGTKGCGRFVETQKKLKNRGLVLGITTIAANLYIFVRFKEGGSQDV
ncbi:hypothetical protein PYCH_15850 [Pyrococcus yayanosii CH1]|uniref:Uncharacterized protein n=1 Tax=Pyrococcus yayanosii (strain CH1 / JCM 16557) TaxID=529709 RepID=F8AGW0_PYRYC|nr:hypothetical protein PYCH_15850 [Pyrococcus yayanosii CH1]